MPSVADAWAVRLHIESPVCPVRRTRRDRWIEAREFQQARGIIGTGRFASRGGRRPGSLPTPIGSFTHAITIGRSSRDVWPWLFRWAQAAERDGAATISAPCESCRVDPVHRISRRSSRPPRLRASEQRSGALGVHQRDIADVVIANLHPVGVLDGVANPARLSLLKCPRTGDEPVILLLVLVAMDGIVQIEREVVEQHQALTTTSRLVTSAKLIRRIVNKRLNQHSAFHDCRPEMSRAGRTSVDLALESRCDGA